MTKTLGTVGRNLKMWVGMTGIHGKIALLKKSCLLGTEKILRRPLDT